MQIPIAAVAVALTLFLEWTAQGADSDNFRPYFTIRAGGAIYSDARSISGLELTNPSQYPFPQVSLGANFNKYWSAELAVDFVETHIEVPGVTGRLGEYATWTVLPQLRLRYPLFNDTFVPYVVGGVGLGIGEFNDRNVLHGDIAFGGSADTALIETFGVGVDWFFERNIAINVEAKRLFGFETDVSFQGRNQRLDANSTLISGGLRVLLADPRTSGNNETARKPADTDEFRGYVAFRTGAAFFANDDSVPGLTIESPTRVLFGGVAGANFDKHWGVELSFDYWEPKLEAAGFGVVSEYALWTVLAHLRYRHPVLDGRLVPYLLGGAGVGWAQVNDKSVPFSAYPLADQTITPVIGSIGAGVDYFLTYNVALGLEARYLIGFEGDIKVGNQTSTIDNSTVLALAGVRVLFP